MEAVKNSRKFQVLIPKKLREALRLSPGQKIQMVAYGDRIEMIPLKKISEMKGFLKGIDTTVDRETEQTWSKNEESCDEWFKSHTLAAG
jgi:AbrB family looped-hinge helix DNA binding protein